MTISPPNHIQKTLKRYYQYLAMHPNDTSVMLVLGHVCLQHNLIRKGIDALEHAQSIDPQNLRILWPLARAYQTNHSHKKLITLVNHALSIEPNHLGFQHMRADHFAEHGDPVVAETIIQSLLEENPNHIPLMISLARSLYHQNKVIRAQRVVDQIKKMPMNDPSDSDIQSLEELEKKVANRYKELAVKPAP